MGDILENSSDFSNFGRETQVYGNQSPLQPSQLLQVLSIGIQGTMICLIYLLMGHCANCGMFVGLQPLVAKVGISEPF